MASKKVTVACEIKSPNSPALVWYFAASVETQKHKSLTNFVETHPLKPGLSKCFRLAPY